MLKNEELIVNKELREQAINRVEVLDKVGDLLMLGESDYATTNQVADYYGVGKEAIKTIVFNNNDELLSDGVKELSSKETKEFLASCGIQPTNFRGYFIADNQKFSNKKSLLFPKRAILRIGMLLRDSEVAKEIRSRLLDIVHDAEKGNPEIIENIVSEITEEKQLILDRVEAEIKGDYYEVSVINAKLFAIKNKRIKELEDEVQTITTHQLTLTESRNVVNKLVRTIGFKEYGAVGKAFNELYKILNYQLGINVKNRKKNKNESYLHTLNEDEMFKTEKVVRNWANELGIDVEKSISLIA